jgi:hypothetical protein
MSATAILDESRGHHLRFNTIIKLHHGFYVRFSELLEIGRHMVMNLGTLCQVATKQGCMTGRNKYRLSM